MDLFDFVILTDDNFIQPPNAKTQTGWKEDNMLRGALENKGFKVDRKSWSDPDFDWASTKAVIFRTTWDYFDRFDEWKAWLQHASTKTRLINQAELVYWNMDKHYLRDLQTKGINIPETRYIEIGEKTSLSTLHQETGWTETILKPCVAGSARHTYRLESHRLEQYENTFHELISREAMMLQPFQYNILVHGEISLIVIGGTCTHAVIKKAKTGDFRVQDNFGGSVSLYEPNSEEMAFAEKAVAACDSLPAYARVDIIRDNGNQLALIEIELIEPELWFRLKPEAADILAGFLANPS
ncbi:MAG: hypothetical protein HEP71_05485 [Roseivirga sp.]|nr:hypothetical protein [Roseivirga sp.]